MEATEEKGRLTVTDRRLISIDGVEAVLSFEEDYLSLETSLGSLSVEGEGLKIENLSKDKGQILIRGRIDGVYYTKEKPRKKLFGGFGR